jgi:hypothetical protein
MLQLIWRLFFLDRKAKLARLVQLAARMDELLITGKIESGTRQQLQAGREDLERQIRLLMSA